MSPRPTGSLLPPLLCLTLLPPLLCLTYLRLTLRPSWRSWQLLCVTWSKSGRRFFNIDVSASLWPSGPTFQELDVRLRAHTRGFFLLFGSPCTLHYLSGAMSSPRLNMTSLWPLHLHVDRGLERHVYPWVPTNKCPRGPCQVDPTYQKPRWPASESEDLIHKPDDLGRLRAILSRSWRVYDIRSARQVTRARPRAACRSENHGIPCVIRDDNLPSCNWPKYGSTDLEWKP
jgi:hypothetical protein